MRFFVCYGHTWIFTAPLHAKPKRSPDALRSFSEDAWVTRTGGGQARTPARRPSLGDTGVVRLPEASHIIIGR